MKTSQNGIDLIKRFEGLELESYQDIAGIWTIGYGHTGREVGPDQKITTNEAEALLRHDLVSREKAISRLTRIKINQNEFDALVSFVYNVGIGAYERSTARRRLNKGQRTGAADALTWFNKATVNGVLREVLGLSRRRAVEKALFLTPVEELSARPADIDDNARITPVEDPPRRGAISDSRTVQGATIAGGAGVAASNMGRDASEELDDMETTIETGGTLITVEGSEGEGEAEALPTIPELDGEVPQGPDDTPSEGAPEDIEAEGTTDPVGPADNTGTMVEVPSQYPAKHIRHEADAQIQLALMVVIVLAVLFIIYARIDDWFRYRR